MRSKQIVYTVLVLLAISSVSLYAPVASAVPSHSILTDYYDSSLNPVGYTYRSCSGSWQQEGTLSGEWKEVRYEPCDGGVAVYEYFHYCNGVWVQVAYVGDTSC